MKFDTYTYIPVGWKSITAPFHHKDKVRFNDGSESYLVDEMYKTLGGCAIAVINNEGMVEIHRERKEIRTCKEVYKTSDFHAAFRGRRVTGPVVVRK